jgi:hypothetical protein
MILAMMLAVAIFMCGSALFMFFWNASLGAVLDAKMTFVQAVVASALVWTMKVML